MSQRAQFATKLGAIAATVGSAVGLGNIWRFPCEAGEHGGGAFLIIYLACVMLLGVPVMVCEFVIGRHSHKNVIGALKTLSKGGKFYLVGYVGIVASILILSFYSVVCGWIIEYLFQAILGNLKNFSPEDYGYMFSLFVANPYRTVLWTVIYLCINFMILRKGVRKGIERVTRIMMPLLFVLLIMFCVVSISLPKATEGLEFLFNPDFSQLTPTVVIGAMGQAFFSLSLGLSCLLTYASYFKDKDSLVGNATTIALLDTLVAILAGIMIFPAVFSFGMQPEAGPKLVFEIIPSIFNQIPGAYIWAVLFFLLLFFASITSTISMSEISIAAMVEEGKMSRSRATAIVTVVAILLGSLCALSFNVLAEFKIFGLTLFELFDFVSSNILLPAGGIFFAWFVGWYIDRRVISRQLGYAKKRKTSHKIVLFCARYIAPVAIIIIFLYGLKLF